MRNRNARRGALAGLALLVLTLTPMAPTALAQDFTWTGWFGPPESNPAWGHHWVEGQYLFNAWGHSWHYSADPEPHYPGSSSWVLIPDGVVVDIEGGQAARCGSLTIAPGAYLELPNSSLAVTGPVIDNQGSIFIGGYAGSWGSFEINGPVTFTGDGEIQFDQGRFASWNPVMTVTIESGQHVAGLFQFGWQPYGNYHGIDLTNRGVVEATSPTSSSDIFSLQSVNRGTIGAAPGAHLRLFGGFDNTGGEIVAADGALVEFYGSSTPGFALAGGTLRTTGTGEIQPVSRGLVTDVTVDGVLHIRRYADVSLAGVVTNFGTIDQGHDGGSGWATVYLAGDLDYLGDGLLQMGSGARTKMPAWPDSSATLVNGPEHTIESFGAWFGEGPNYYGDQRLELLNQGTLLCRGGTHVDRFEVTGAGFENQGTVIIDHDLDQDPRISGEFRQTAGLLACDDRWRMDDGNTFAFTGGTLAGHGSLDGPVVVGQDAVIHPGREGEVGILTLRDSLNLNQGATLVCEWSLAGRDRLDVHGPLTATGTVRLRIEYRELRGELPRGADYTVLVCGEVDDQAIWELELPEGWSSDGLVWQDGALVVRELTGWPTAAPEMPAVTALHGAAPNPFNPVTTLRFALPQDGPVHLWIADLAGRRVRSVLHEHRPAGAHAVRWDGRDAAGRELGSGTYLAILDAAGARRSVRMTLVR
jgi:hypothetical protein